MRTSKNISRKGRSALGIPAKKRPRGRPSRVNKQEIITRAYYWRRTFEQYWKVLKEPLLSGRTENEIKNALTKLSIRFADELAHLAPLILKVRQEKTFPKTRRARIRRFAESLAGLGEVAPRTSRDICAKERKIVRHTIIRRAIYIECTCGHKGFDWYGSCPKCQTENLGDIERAREQGLKFNRPPPPKEEA